MKIEDMADMTLEKAGQIEPERNFYFTSNRENIDKYFGAGSYKVAIDLSRKNLVPQIDIIQLTDLATLEKAEEVFAEVAVVDDPDYEKINPTTEEGKKKIGILTYAKGVALKAQNTDPKVVARIDAILDKFIDGIGKVTAKVGKKRGMALASAFAFGLASCAPVVSASAPVFVSGGPSPTPEVLTTPTDVVKAPTETSVAPTSLAATPDTSITFDGRTFKPPEISSVKVEYDTETQKAVDEIQKEYGVSIIITKDENVDFTHNDWIMKYINVIKYGLSQLPPGYYKDPGSPKEIWVNRTISDDYEDTGGVADLSNFSIKMNTSTAFTPGVMFDSAAYPDYLNIYRTMDCYFVATLIHEWTHTDSMEMHPEIMDEWIKATGWHYSNGTWTNDHPGEVKALVYGGEVGSQDHASPPTPYEDIAVSAEELWAEQLWNEPITVSQDRIDFFLENRYFKDWAALKNIKRIMASKPTTSQP